MKTKPSIFGIKSYFTSITTINVYVMQVKVNNFSVNVQQNSLKAEYKNYSSMKSKKVFLCLCRTEPIYSPFHHNNHRNNLYKSVGRTLPGLIYRKMAIWQVQFYHEQHHQDYFSRAQRHRGAKPYHKYHSSSHGRQGLSLVYS